MVARLASSVGDIEVVEGEVTSMLAAGSVDVCGMTVRLHVTGRGEAVWDDNERGGGAE